MTKAGGLLARARTVITSVNAVVSPPMLPAVAEWWWFSYGSEALTWGFAALTPDNCHYPE
ncbi:hypothetical protein IU501_33100 [Nocardia otitidiscaviarum]|uniref:hypothetical protein n=1 Tax=Nocardia otitidiscaviarum TaxID=1823 RepID=UPI0011DD0907|nr:hypothetical protein [Nocardia otitidiscaviarum]MBF6137810.1 hypothetical protein [Nocardia otitidiscaviarum]MBF6485333.1 hypothetical protein [Nocardia otitidiscaviarum]